MFLLILGSILIRLSSNRVCYEPFWALFLPVWVSQANPLKVKILLFSLGQIHTFEVLFLYWLPCTQYWSDQDDFDMFSLQFWLNYLMVVLTVTDLCDIVHPSMKSDAISIWWVPLESSSKSENWMHQNYLNWISGSLTVTFLIRLLFTSLFFETVSGFLQTAVISIMSIIKTSDRQELTDQDLIWDLTLLEK